MISLKDQSMGMKRIKFFIVFGLLSLLLNAGSTINAQSVVTGYSFSSDLQTGDIYYWRLNQLIINRTGVDTVTIMDGLRNGSIIEIEITAPLTSLDVPLENNLLDDYFIFRLDGVEINMSDPIVGNSPNFDDAGDLYIRLYEVRTVLDNETGLTAVGGSGLLGLYPSIVTVDGVNDYYYMDCYLFGTIDQGCSLDNYSSIFTKNGDIGTIDLPWTKWIFNQRYGLMYYYFVNDTGNMMEFELLNPPEETQTTEVTVTANTTSTVFETTTQTTVIPTTTTQTNLETTIITETTIETSISTSSTVVTTLDTSFVTETKTENKSEAGNSYLLLLPVSLITIHQINKHRRKITSNESIKL